jgi:ABC-type glutathione transport system ATPase component
MFAEIVGVALRGLPSVKSRLLLDLTKSHCHTGVSTDCRPYRVTARSNPYNQDSMSTQTSSITQPSTQRVALRCAGLVKRFADVTAVNGLDLEVFAGECFGLLGPNGAGKTTTVEILEGLTPADEGRVEVLGQEWNSGG